MENGEAGRKPKLILHFDIRNTVLVADSVTNVSVEGALNSYLTSVAWGRVQNGEWELLSAKPSITKPSEAVTYYKYWEQRSIRSPEDRLSFRKRSGAFCRSPLGCPFLPTFQRHLKMLEYEHEEETDLIMRGESGRAYHYILPSFFHLLAYLYENRQHQDFAIIFRTYGLDSENVLRAVQAMLDGRHPSFPSQPRATLNPQPGMLTRSQDQGLELRLGDRVLCGESEIYTAFNSLPHDITAVKDDFPFWMRHSYHHSAGKPLMLKDSDSDHVHVFFDDNIRKLERDSIIDVRVPSRQGGWGSLSCQEMESLYGGNLIQMDLLSAISDPRYFIAAIEASLAHISDGRAQLSLPHSLSPPVSPMP